MTKAELVEKMAKDAGISKVAAGKALQSFQDCIAKGLKGGGTGDPGPKARVTLVGFGTFSKVRRKARKGRNPQTGESIKIKARSVVQFRPGKKLRDSI